MAGKFSMRNGDKDKNGKNGNGDKNGKQKALPFGGKGAMPFGRKGKGRGK